MPGYLSDLYSAFYPLSAASPALRELHLEDHGLRWTHARPPWSVAPAARPTMTPPSSVATSTAPQQN